MPGDVLAAYNAHLVEERVDGEVRNEADEAVKGLEVVGLCHGEMMWRE